MNFTPNLVVGVITTLLGVVLLLDRMGLVAASSLWSYWPVALILFGASLVVQALRPASATEGPRQRPIISPGFVILMAIVWLIASNTPPFRTGRAGDAAQGTISLMSVMSQDTRVSEATPFRGATMTSVMGGSRLDLRGAQLAPGEEATIDVFGLMGRVLVDVPAEWEVDIQTTMVMGGARDRRGRDRSEPDSASGDAPAAAPVASGAALATRAAPPRLVLRGVVIMGGLVIRS